MSPSTKEMGILKTNIYFLHIMGNNSFTTPLLSFTLMHRQEK